MAKIIKICNLTQISDTSNPIYNQMQRQTSQKIVISFDATRNLLRRSCAKSHTAH